MRSYRAIVKRLESLDDALELSVLGEASGYPIFGVQTPGPEDRPEVYLSGGTHGDEPAGVAAVLAFLEHDWVRWADRFRFRVLPCLNPWGYVHGRRENERGIDLNWAFTREDLPEIQVVRNWVRGRRFELAVDFHEDWESPGFYLYELRRNGEPVGERVIARVRPICPINDAPTIEGDPAHRGVIHPDPEAPRRRERGAGIPISLFQHHTDHLVTTETPTMRPIEERIQAHRIALETLLEAHLRSAARPSRADRGA